MTTYDVGFLERDGPNITIIGSNIVKLYYDQPMDKLILFTQREPLSITSDGNPTTIVTTKISSDTWHTTIVGGVSLLPIQVAYSTSPDDWDDVVTAELELRVVKHPITRTGSRISLIFLLIIFVVVLFIIIFIPKGGEIVFTFLFFFIFMIGIVSIIVLSTAKYQYNPV